ncbi:MAG: DUF3467 domain-containing protein [Candidatus Eisenbacteria bacterium]|uniref:DUF3467 domain-containing protein n=1 Tax=Eiseniibacteriota bacterium TaxID=2212470 RepID=A0A538TSY2_UNCEI|nr:MAG: DUF3467 domain-containing protein [Candidatus Eisenbacteria bacterium]
MEAKRQEQPPQINMEIGEREAEGIYSNFVVISHSLSEFVLDFARVLPGTPKSKVFARIVMTPPNVRALLHALETNIGKYEGQFGKIRTLNEGQSKEIGFTS